MLLKDFVNKKIASADKEASAEGVPLTLNNCKKYKKMRDLKVYGNSFQSTLPYPYQSVTYIESTGGQYIDTGLSIFNNSTYKIELDFMPMDFYNYNVIIGTASNATTHEAWITSDGFLYFRYNNIKPDEIQLTVNQQINLTLECDGSTVYEYIDDELKVSYSTSISLLDSAVYLLRRGGYFGKDRIYSCNIYTSGNLVRSMVPCYNVQTNAVGLYDTVNSVFYSNQGSGVFVKGSNTAPTVDNPIEVESLGEKTENLFGGVYAEYWELNLTKGDKYTVSIDDASSETMYLLLYDSAKTRLQHVAITAVSNGRRSATFTVEYDDIQYVMFGWSIAGATLIDAQIKVGEATDYEPYGKYKISVVQRGIHIVNPKSFVGGSMTDNGDETYTLHWTSSNRFSRNNTECSKIPVGSKIYVSASIVDDNLNNSRLGVMLWHTDNTQSYWQITKTWSPTFTVTKPIYYITLYINSEEEMGAWITFKDLIVCYSDEFSGYEPYVEPITTNIYLDEPLRKLSSYADYIDGKNDKVVRNIKEFTFTGQEEGLTTTNTGNIFALVNAGMIFGSPTMANRFETRRGISDWSNVPDYLVYTLLSNQILYIKNVDIENTLDAFKSYLGDLYAQGTPLTCLFVSCNAGDEPLNIDLPKLNAKTTIIEVDTSLAPSNISGKYILR